MPTCPMKTMKMFTVLPAKFDADFYFKIDDDVAVNMWTPWPPICRPSATRAICTWFASCWSSWFMLLQQLICTSRRSCEMLCECMFSGMDQYVTALALDKIMGIPMQLAWNVSEPPSRVLRGSVGSIPNWTVKPRHPSTHADESEGGLGDCRAA